MIALAAVRRGWITPTALSNPLAVSTSLLTPAGFSSFARPIAPVRFSLRPAAGRRPARLVAVTLEGLIRNERGFAALKKTAPTAQPRRLGLLRLEF